MLSLMLLMLLLPSIRDELLLDTPGGGRGVCARMDENTRSCVSGGGNGSTGLLSSSNVTKPWLLRSRRRRMRNIVPIIKPIPIATQTQMIAMEVSDKSETSSSCWVSLLLGSLIASWDKGMCRECEWVERKGEEKVWNQGNARTHTQLIHFVLFANNGNRLISAFENPVSGSIQLSDWSSGQWRYQLPGAPEVDQLSSQANGGIHAPSMYHGFRFKNRPKTMEDGTMKDAFQQDNGPGSSKHVIKKIFEGLCCYLTELWTLPRKGLCHKICHALPVLAEIFYGIRAQQVIRDVTLLDDHA